MTRRITASEVARQAKAKRTLALQRSELRAAPVPHKSAAGATSAPIKCEDPEIRKMIDDALAARAESQ